MTYQEKHDSLMKQVGEIDKKTNALQKEWQTLNPGFFGESKDAGRSAEIERQLDELEKKRTQLFDVHFKENKPERGFGLASDQYE